MFNEVHSIHGHTLLLITKPSLQATALLQHLKQSLAITGKLHNIQRSLDDISSGSIILLDMMEADKKLIHYWQDTLSRKNNNIKILLLNTPEDYPYRDIENWPHINGVFYAMEDQERVVNGLQGVLRGECYFTQKLASYLITHSGNYRYNSTESALLTHREKEIRESLGKYPNVRVYITGLLFPIPAKLLYSVDVFLSSAGSAFATANLGIPTISYDANDLQPIGILQHTTQNSIFRGPGEPPASAEELLSEVLIQKKYLKNIHPIPDVHPDFSSHMDFVSQMSPKREYYDFKNYTYSRKEKLKRLLILCFGYHAVDWLRDVRRYLC